MYMYTTGMKLQWHSLNLRASNDAMKRCLPSEKSKIHQYFQHLFKAYLILLIHAPALALQSTN